MLGAARNSQSGEKAACKGSIKELYLTNKVL